MNNKLERIARHIKYLSIDHDELAWKIVDLEDSLENLKQYIQEINIDKTK